ncbi:MAG TPA: four helix bundle protein [Terriglobales bacterium]|nr:four helix bundle protein [Terriglobales bacterium]
MHEQGQSRCKGGGDGEKALRSDEWLVASGEQRSLGAQMKVNSYRDLLVWQKAVDLVTEIYRLTRQYPKDELYGITGQLRRAAVSIPSNIAEGQARLSTGEFRQFLGNANSLAEVETQLVISGKLDYMD